MFVLIIFQHGLLSVEGYYNHEPGRWRHGDFANDRTTSCVWVHKTQGGLEEFGSTRETESTVISSVHNGYCVKSCCILTVLLHASVVFPLRKDDWSDSAGRKCYQKREAVD